MTSSVAAALEGGGEGGGAAREPPEDDVPALPPTLTPLPMGSLSSRSDEREQSLEGARVRMTVTVATCTLSSAVMDRVAVVAPTGRLVQLAHEIV